MTASALPPERRRPRAAAPLETILDAIGGTPCVRLGRVAPAGGAAVFAKVESFNPGGSVKDRIAASMIEAAERDGRLAPGGLVVEATSGNTGIRLALVCAVKGYRLTLVMPDSTSIEHRQALEAHGAEIVLTPAEEAMAPSIARARELAERDGGMARLVGNTPLVRLRHIGSEIPGIRLYVKCEFMNPGGSIKDRAALRMIKTALADGRFGPERT
ncbi:MAG TPA: pyridoxal-phosphate dependent enzyme, partial [Anaeromyxobacteraceae bacterium]